MEREGAEGETDSLAVILGPLLNTSLPQFLHLSSGANHSPVSHLMRLGELRHTCKELRTVPGPGKYCSSHLG